MGNIDISNCKIHIRHQIYEESELTAKYYSGFYSININSLVTIMFIPRFDIPHKGMPPKLPADLDEINSENDARLFTATLSDYSISPSSKLVGAEEVFEIQSSNDKSKRVIFYISESDFVLFEKELSHLADQLSSIYDSFKVADISHTNIYRYLVSTVLTSENFSKTDLQKLK